MSAAWNTITREFERHVKRHHGDVDMTRGNYGALTSARTRELWLAFNCGFRRAQAIERKRRSA